MRWRSKVPVLPLVLLSIGALGHGAGATERELVLSAVEREPKEGRRALSPDEIAALRQAVAGDPQDRGKRFALVRGLQASGDLAGAVAEARAWRAKDAYNLVVVRLLGDLYAELGDKEKASRVYSAVAELLPGDPSAQRALATVLKQGGDLEGARARLEAALTANGANGANGGLRDDVRLGFELADVEQRLGRTDDAARRFAAIADAGAAPEQVRYPAKQRLAQIKAAARREALARGDTQGAKSLAAELDRLGVKGGSVNDIKVYLTWDTDRSDVDLWVKTPDGELVNYKQKEGRGGEALFDDVTTGYGPESFTAREARAGEYAVQVNYFGTGRQGMTEARGEVLVVLHEGTAREARHALPYRLFKPGQTVTVATIGVR